MFSPFIINDKNLFLDRFPPGQVNRSLQAWDATDEHLLSHFAENFSSQSPLNILVVNDSFGAITCNLTEHNTYAINDSFLSEQGIKYNLEQNHLEHQNISLLSSLDPLPENIDVILFRIPKSKALLIEQLDRIHQAYSESINTPVIIAGAKAKEIHTATLKTFERILGDTTTSLAVKKSRLVFSQFSLPKQTTSTDHRVTWPLEQSTFSITNLANVFAREKLDIGARLFLKHLPDVKAKQQVIDLGCGNGVLGLTILSKQANAEVTFRDESYMAVESARINVEQNLPETLNNATFTVGDCLSDIAPSSADFILCNPPFHQQFATTDHIAWQMFKESFKVLKKGGELRIVGNRQLGYHVKLKRLFGNSTLIASDNKFVILSAIKQ